MMMIKSTYMLLALLVFSCTGLGAECPKTGIVHKKIKAIADASHSYALYLPTCYSTDKKYPLLFGFSPKGKGSQIADLYRKSAERFGWIIAASNNSKNGSDNTEACSVLWKDVTTRYSIDMKRLYATGLSGGGQMACIFAQGQENEFAGVISHARGSLSCCPRTKSKTVYMLITGEKDFNISESVRFWVKSKSLGTPCRINIHAQGHSWGPESVLEAALRYLQLHSHLDNSDADEKTFHDLLQEEFEHLKLRLSSRSFLFEVERLIELAAWAKGTKAGKTINKYVTKLLKEEKERLEVGRKAMKTLQDKCQLDTAILGRYPSIESLSKVNTARRTIVSEYSDTTAGWLAFLSLSNSKKSLSRADISYGIGDVYACYLTNFKMPSFEPVLKAAKKHAKNKEPKRSIRSLWLAVDLGFADKDRITGDKYFRRLKKVSGWKALLDALK